MIFLVSGENMNFVVLVKVVFSFLTNIKLPFCKKKDDFFPKSASKDEIYKIRENDDINHRNDNIRILCTFMETLVRAFICCFPI